MGNPRGAPIHNPAIAATAETKLRELFESSARTHAERAGLAGMRRPPGSESMADLMAMFSSRTTDAAEGRSEFPFGRRRSHGGSGGGNGGSASGNDGGAVENSGSEAHANGAMDFDTFVARIDTADPSVRRSFDVIYSDTRHRIDMENLSARWRTDPRRQDSGRTQLASFFGRREDGTSSESDDSVFDDFAMGSGMLWNSAVGADGGGSDQPLPVFGSVAPRARLARRRWVPLGAPESFAAAAPLPPPPPPPIPFTIPSSSSLSSFAPPMWPILPPAPTRPPPPPPPNALSQLPLMPMSIDPGPAPSVLFQQQHQHQQQLMVQRHQGQQQQLLQRQQEQTQRRMRHQQLRQIRDQPPTSIAQAIRDAIHAVRSTMDPPSSTSASASAATVLAGIAPEAATSRARRVGGTDTIRHGTTIGHGDDTETHIFSVVIPIESLNNGGGGPAIETSLAVDGSGEGSVQSPFTGASTAGTMSVQSMHEFAQETAQAIAQAIARHRQQPQPNSPQVSAVATATASSSSGSTTGAAESTDPRQRDRPATAALSMVPPSSSAAAASSNTETGQVAAATPSQARATRRTVRRTQVRRNQSGGGGGSNGSAGGAGAGGGSSASAAN
ncbi:hypothetical protein BC828DRAFT_378714 [Blastocladiella britannica]|nr:hypothetical protein BC828DRAFT_378714 [Blastocladiella britannica]